MQELQLVLLVSTTDKKESGRVHFIRMCFCMYVKKEMN